jgi:hypothetical protein
LWAAAAEAAGEYGVGRTAQVLRWEYGKLKQLVESPRAVAKGAGKRSRRAKFAASAPAFLELVGPPAIGLSECRIEWEGPHGKLRIQWKGTTAPDLAGLSRVLWEGT